VHRSLLMILIFLASCSTLIPPTSPRLAQAQQNCQYSPDWGQAGESWDPNGRLKDFSRVGFHGGDDPIPYQQRPATISFGPGRHTITQRINLQSGQVLRGAGPDQTTLYFPQGLRQLGNNECPSGANNCYGWDYGVIQAEGASEVGIEDATIEFPIHGFQHNGNYEGWNAITFRSSSHSWVKHVRIRNSDSGVILMWGHHITVDDVEVIANPNGSHYYMTTVGATDRPPTDLNHLFTNIRVGGGTVHGVAGGWSGEYVVFANITPLPGTSGVHLEPDHNGPGTTTFLWSNIQGQISSGDLWRPNSYVWNVGNQSLCPQDIYTAQLDYRLNGPPPPPDPSVCHFDNLARCATATASSFWGSGYDATKVNDGNQGTRWNSAASQTAGAWVALDFGLVRDFDTVTLREAISRITGYQLQVWNGSTWVTVAQGTSIGSEKIHRVGAQHADKVRLLVLSTNATGSAGTPTLSEIEVMQTDTPVDGPPAANAALTATATASSYWGNGYEPTRVNDGQNGTRWNSAGSQTAGAWIALDFGSPIAVHQVVLKEALGRIMSYQVQAWDGAQWVQIGSGSTIGPEKVQSVAPVTTQGIRLLVLQTTGSSPTDTPSISEMEVY
jgi:F5/8 type C domain